MFALPISIRNTCAILTLSLSGVSQATPFSAQTPVNISSQAVRDMQTLASEEMQGRGIGTEGSARAREYILKRIAEIGLKPCGKDFVQEFSVKGRSNEESIGKNIIACQAGAKDTKNSIVVSAHYDHLGTTNKKIYFGADDNASGVAGVLAVATYLKQNPPINNIIYAFFDGEEIGLRGANAFVKQQAVMIDSVIANINFDMIARGDKNELFASGTYQTPSFKTTLASLNGIGGIKFKFDHDRPEQGNNDWTNQSDHYAFYNAGVPHLYLGVEDHADYHKPSDTADKVNATFFNAAIEIAQKTVALIDQTSATIDYRAERKKYSSAK